jgi:ATP-dependent RNA helicase DeaD
VTEPVRAFLSRLGLPEGDPNLAEVVPAAARGNNLLVVTPPSALHALPGLAGATRLLADHPTGILLVLAAEAATDEWERAAAAVAGETGHAVHAVRSLARASRLLQAGAVNILISSPESALALAQRSALKAERIAGIVMAWPELWAGDESLPPLMQDIGRDVPRIIYTTDPDRIGDLVERHARRAHRVGPFPADMPVTDGTEGGRAGTVRIVTCPWSQRNQALRLTIELLDPATSAAWFLVSDPRFSPEVPPGTSAAVRAIPAASLVVAYDIPTAAQLAQLVAAADVVLLVPPAALPWVRRVAPGAETLRLPGAFDAAISGTRDRRERIARAIADRSPEGGLLALAPLFDRFDPALVAAALYDLWLERPIAAQSPAAPAPAALPGNATARVWVGVGKKDGATPNDFVGVMTKELRYDRAKIGKIEVRELYSLVEVPAADAESLATRLTGVTVRRRRVTARLDQGGKVPRGRSG